MVLPSWFWCSNTFSGFFFEIIWQLRDVFGFHPRCSPGTSWNSNCTSYPNPEIPSKTQFVRKKDGKICLGDCFEPAHFPRSGWDFGEAIIFRGGYLVASFREGSLIVNNAVCCLSPSGSLRYGRPEPPEKKIENGEFNLTSWEGEWKTMCCIKNIYSYCVYIYTDIEYYI